LPTPPGRAVACRSAKRRFGPGHAERYSDGVLPRLGRVTPDLPLARLGPHLRAREPLGIWAREARHTLRLSLSTGGASGRVLIAPDLGSLLASVPRVILSDGSRLRLLMTRAGGRSVLCPVRSRG
jgi:hypothetical protein